MQMADIIGTIKRLQAEHEKLLLIKAKAKEVDGLQQDYFRNRTNKALAKSKDAERELREMIRIFDGQPATTGFQTDLF